jgi:hypothetical protein
MAKKKNSKKKTRTNAAINKIRNTKEGERKTQEKQNRRAPTTGKVY